MGNKAHIERMLDITPERLVACGFEELKGRHMFEKRYDVTHALLLHLSHGIYYPIIAQEPASWADYEQTVSLRGITKMHELQALWKVLTGEKLTSDAT
jgi:hypothetical protein